MSELEQKSQRGFLTENASLVQEADRQFGRIRAYLASQVPRP